jgi:hypothetical protein
MKPVLRAVVFCLAGSISAFGCTTNVEEPVVNQTGRTGNTACIQSCDDGKTTCVAKCTDDACKATCETNHTTCTSSCASNDGG